MGQEITRSTYIDYLMWAYIEIYGIEYFMDMTDSSMFERLVYHSNEAYDISNVLAEQEKIQSCEAMDIGV